jgi:hypothetical protein
VKFYLDEHIPKAVAEGIVFSQAGRRSVGELIESLVLIANVIEPEEMRNHIEFI